LWKPTFYSFHFTSIIVTNFHSHSMACYCDRKLQNLLKIILHHCTFRNEELKDRKHFKCIIETNKFWNLIQFFINHNWILINNVIWKEYLFIAVDWIYIHKSNYLYSILWLNKLYSFTSFLLWKHKNKFVDFIVNFCVEYY